MSFTDSGDPEVFHTPGYDAGDTGDDPSAAAPQQPAQPPAQPTSQPTAQPTSQPTAQQGAIPDQSGADQSGAPGGVAPFQPMQQPKRSSALKELWELAHQVLAYGMQKNGIGPGNNAAGAGDTPDNSAPVTDNPDQQGGAIPDANGDAQRMAGAPSAIAGKGIHGIESALGALGQWAGRNSPEQQGGNSQTAGGAGDESTGPVSTDVGFDGKPRQDINKLAANDKGQVSRLWNYIMGGDAMQPTTRKAIENAVDPQGASPPNSRALQAVKYAHDKGPDASWATLQSYRKDFDNAKGVAAGALNHGDIPAALQAANKAFENLPGPSQVIFKQGSAGTIDALVSGEDGVKSIPLQPKAFKDLMMGHGSFDNMVLAGAESTLQTMSRPIQQAAQQRSGVLAAAAQPGGYKPAQAPTQRPSQGSPAGKNPNADYPILQAPKGVDQDTYDAAMRMFPNVSQSAQREQWIQQQVSGQQEHARSAQTAKQSNESKERVAKINAEGRVQQADTRGQHGEAMSRIRAAGQAQVMDAKVRGDLQKALQKQHDGTADTVIKQHALLLNSIIKNAPLGLDLDQLDQQLKKFGGGVSQILGDDYGQQTRPAAASGQASNASQTQAGGSGSPKGKWVVRPGGDPNNPKDAVWKSSP